MLDGRIDVSRFAETTSQIVHYFCTLQMFYGIYHICLQYSDYFYIFVRFIFYGKYWNTFASHCVLETCSFHSPFSSSSDIYIYIGISLAPFLYTSSRNFSLKLLHYIYMCTRLLHRLICRPFFFIFLLSTRRERPFTNHFASVFILFTQGGGKRVIEVFRYIVIAFLFSFFFFFIIIFVIREILFTRKLILFNWLNMNEVSSVPLTLVEKQL